MHLIMRHLLLLGRVGSPYYPQYYLIERLNIIKIIVLSNLGTSTIWTLDSSDVARWMFLWPAPPSWTDSQKPQSTSPLAARWRPFWFWEIIPTDYYVYPISSSTHVASGDRPYRFSQLPIQMWSWPTPVKACNKCHLFLTLRLRCHVWRTALKLDWNCVYLNSRWMTFLTNIFWNMSANLTWGQRENGWHWMSSDSYWVESWWFWWASPSTEWCWGEHQTA